MPTHYFQEPKLVPDAVERAKKGDRDASRNLLEAFADFADAKKPAPAALVDYDRIGQDAHERVLDE